MSMTRKYKMDMLKKELGTNGISEVFHMKYGEKPNIKKSVLKTFGRWLKKKRKEAHKKARMKRREEKNV